MIGQRSSPSTLLTAAAGLAALCLSAVSLSGCASEEPAPSTAGSAELLLREPGRVLDQPGVLSVDPHAGWGRFDAAGWELLAENGPGGAFLWTAASHAELDLPTLGTGDPQIQVDVVARITGAPVEIRARLAGVDLGTARVDELPQTLVFDVPPSAWRNGSNQLVLEFDRTETAWRDLTQGGVSERGIGVSQVRYASRRTVDHTPETGLVLSHSTRVSYALERHDLEPGGELVGSVRSQVEGLLEFGLVLRHGGQITSHSLGARHQVEVGPATDGTFQLGLDDLLPTEALESGTDAALTVTWRSDDAGGAELESLRIVASHSANAPRPRVLPPIVFVSVDTLTAKSLSIHGYERPTSPNLEAFARDSVLFEHCRANTTSTLPSYLSQFTGLLPDANRVLEADGPIALNPWDQRQVAPERWTLAEALNARGYRTGAVIANTWLGLGRGLDRGFEHFDLESTGHSSGEPGWGAPRIFDAALDWLTDAADSRPAFVLVQVLDVHGPYLPGEGWRGRFGSDTSDAGPRLPVVPSTNLIARSVGRSLLPSLGLDSDYRGYVDGARLRAAYDENLAEFDAHFGAFIDGLRERGLYDDALIVVSADHGETMDEPRFVFAHAFPDEQTLHVPLLMKLPGSRCAGTRIDAPVQLVDLYPTLLEAVGLDPANRILHGRSLWSLANGTDDGSGWSERVLVALDGAYRSRAIVRGKWKLVETPLTELAGDALLSWNASHRAWTAFDPRTSRRAADLGIHPDRIAELWLEHDDPFGGVTTLEPLLASLGAFYASQPAPLRELFDLDADPLGLVDVAQQHPALVTELSAELERRAEACVPLRVGIGSSSTAAESGSLERLRALGYLGGE